MAGEAKYQPSLMRRVCPLPQASTSESHRPKSSRRRFLRLISLRKERFFLGVERSFRVSLSARPASQHEGDFVDEVGNVIGHVERLGCSSRIVNLAKEVTCWVDGPSQAHDDTHVVKRLLDGFGRGARRLSRFPSKDLEEDESPAAHTQSETSPWIDCLGLTSVTEGKHANGANQEFPEASWANRCFRGFQDEVELDHLQRDSDAPIDVPVHNWAPANGDPV